jgi:hypothetical protein
MLPEISLLDELDRGTYERLWSNLSGVSADELDWRPHPEANSIRWIVGHLIWFEEWVPDAIDKSGRYLSDRWPTTLELTGLDEMRTAFDGAVERYRAKITGLTEPDLTVEVDYFGAYSLSVRDVLRTHTLHLSGHRYQVRYIRGAFSRAHGKSKAAFDPW